MRISDWSSDVCSSDLPAGPDPRIAATQAFCDALRATQPPLYAAIEPDALQPDEAPYMFDMTFMPPLFLSIPNVPSSVEWLSRHDLPAPSPPLQQTQTFVQWQTSHPADRNTCTDRNTT